MTTLNIGNQSFDSKDIAVKVQEDIAFLASRLKHLEQQRNLNPVVLETYRSMLESRIAVHEWLCQQFNSESDPTAPTAVTQTS